MTTIKQLKEHHRKKIIKCDSCTVTINISLNDGIRKTHIRVHIHILVVIYILYPCITLERSTY